jgi:hypothetical protein
LFRLFCDSGATWRIFHFYENLAQILAKLEAEPVQSKDLVLLIAQPDFHTFRRFCAYIGRLELLLYRFQTFED